MTQAASCRQARSPETHAPRRMPGLLRARRSQALGAPPISTTTFVSISKTSSTWQALTMIRASRPLCAHALCCGAARLCRTSRSITLTSSKARRTSRRFGRSSIDRRNSAIQYFAQLCTMCPCMTQARPLFAASCVHALSSTLQPCAASILRLVQVHAT